MQVILHIGSTKTGSSAMQNFLHKNADVLARKGICYPDVGIASGAHHLIAAAVHPGAFNMHKDSLSASRSERIEQFHTSVRAALDVARAQEARCLILSSEYLWGAFNDDVHSEWATALAGHDVSIYAVLRNPREWVPSSYIQALKSGEGRGIMEWFAHVSKLATRGTDFSKVLSSWETMGPNVRIVPRGYEALLQRDRVFADILEHAGLVRFDRADYVYATRPVNPSPSNAGVTLLQNVNRSNLDDSAKATVRSMVMTHMAKKDPGQPWTFMSDEMGAEIDRYYQPVLAELSTRFDEEERAFLSGYATG